MAVTGPFFSFFFFNDTATTEIYTLSLHDALPICHIRNGEGPSLLLMAGNHGDEYEGELSLAKLIRRLDPKRIKGRVTILPMANAPAVMAAKRCSPLDGGNLNRAFPGDPLGTPTSRLANF